MTDLCRTLRRQGWIVRLARNGHVKLIPPAGGTITAPSTTVGRTA